MCRFASVPVALMKRQIVCLVWSIGRRHSQMHSGVSPCPWAWGTDELCYFVVLLLIVFLGVCFVSPHLRGMELALEDGRCDGRRLGRVRDRPAVSRLGSVRSRLTVGSIELRATPAHLSRRRRTLDRPTAVPCLLKPLQADTPCSPFSQG